MEWRHYSVGERAFMVEYYFRSYAVSGDGCPCLSHVREMYVSRWGKPPPPHSHIVRLVDTFRATGSVHPDQGRQSISPSTSVFYVLTHWCGLTEHVCGGDGLPFSRSQGISRVWLRMSSHLIYHLCCGSSLYYLIVILLIPSNSISILNAPSTLSSSVL